MANEFWKSNDDIHQMMRELVAKNHPDLILLIGATRETDEIVVVFKEKAGKSGGQVVLGNSKKVAPLANALGNTNYKFVLEVASDQWENELGSKQREALIDHLLCACRVEEDPKSGEMKCSVVKPDVSAFRDNIERYGMWFPKEESEGPDSGDDVADVLGNNSEG